ncbi:Na+/H+ antiporter subunit E [Desulfonatronospira sp.]|uniref:Na+/H+ antiporter subunit E n=1 Tax=Desulfonatronospira sp. TaxID=1962951 RepID=UPI0025C10A31|nr:Na+/H+ antiporter subunit E [Desulfonatronospira sp.]
MAQISSGDSSPPGFLVQHRGILIQAALLMALWLVLSGRFYLEPIFYGAVSVAFVVWLNHKARLIPISSGEVLTGNRIYIGRLLKYIPWLLWQIAQSATYVAYLTLHPRMPINPMIVRFDSRLPNPIAKVILGNSITLTPGTLTLDIRGNRFIVHALVQKLEEDLVSGDMESRVGCLYLEHCTPEEMCDDICIMERAWEIKKAVEPKDKGDA